MSDDLSMWDREDLEEMVREQRRNIDLLYADKRDQFAIAALTGLLANPKLQDQILKQGGGDSGWIEESAFKFADTMIELKEKNNGPR